MTVGIGTLLTGCAHARLGTLLGRRALRVRARGAGRVWPGSYTERRELEVGLVVSAVSGGLPVDASDTQILVWHEARYHVNLLVATLAQCTLAGRTGYGGDVVAPRCQCLEQVGRLHESGPGPMH